MNKLKKTKDFLFKKKVGKYLVMGSFAFFLIKGLIWLGIFLFAGLSLINFY